MVGVCERGAAQAGHPPPWRGLQGCRVPAPVCVDLPRPHLMSPFFLLSCFDSGLTSSSEVSVFSDMLRWQIRSVRASIRMLSSHMWR